MKTACILQDVLYIGKHLVGLPKKDQKCGAYLLDVDSTTKGQESSLQVIPASHLIGYPYKAI